MMGEHQLKTWPSPWKAVASGLKRFEVRVDDRGFKAGDTLRLLEWDPVSECYTGREQLVQATYVLTPDTELGRALLQPGVVCMSIMLVPEVDDG
jgi:hypothetical protein